MTSSEYSSSDEDARPKVSDDSDASSKKHKKRPTRNTSSKAIIESAGSSDSDDSDSDGGSDSDNGRGTAGRKRKGSVSMSKKSGASSSAKRKRTMSEESDRGEMDDDLFADEEDRRQVMSMNEKDREQEIFNRMEQQEMRRTRKQIEEKLAAAKNASSGGGDKKEKKEKRKREEKKRVNDADSDEGKSQPSRSKEQSGSKSKGGGVSESESEADMKFHRPSEIHKKATQKNAMADLLAKRKDKENKAAKKAALSIDAVFGKDDSDGSSSSSSISSSTASSRSSSRESSPRRDAESEDEEEKKAARREVETVAELSRARISRYKIAQIVYAPFFAKTVIGCFVRIGLGGYGGKAKYRLSQIVDVVETNKVYSFENLKTNKALKLKYGTDERVFRIEFVSNAQFGEEEFSEWRAVTKEECGSLPTMDHIEKKELDIKKAMNFHYTDEVIEYEIAEQTGDHEAVRRLQNELEELDSRAERAEKKRCADISAINWINQRNRNKMKEQFLGDKVEIDMGHQDDPFTRKKGLMKVVSGTKGAAQLLEAGTSTPPTSSAPPSDMKSSPFMTPSARPPQQSKSASNLFDLHSSINKIELDIDLGKLARPASSRVEDSLHLPSPRPTAPPPTSGSRPLSLEDYRRRKAAAAQAQ
ncbi:RNA polymerase-associated protein RTF1 [Trichostrongylus colubriformis]|uniref:RNA polymerase-associated protein RTF1 n=1 Tax=Trichostrongylus colubriformis TaxID=6319 RepID=A0AAN8FQ96_TRICO